MASAPKSSSCQGRTLAFQDKLPNLPIPSLEDTCKRYLRALEALQDEKEHAATKKSVGEFLHGDGPKLHQLLTEYAKDKASYIEEFWYESYLSHSDPVVLSLNPFFVLENDPSPDRGSQLPRASSLIVSSLGFIHDLRAGLLEPDTVRGTPLDMDQYTRLFGSARIPTENGCHMEVHPDSKHIAVLRRGQFYWFDVLDDQNLPLLTEREVRKILQAIINDADTTDPQDVARGAVGVLSTENRKVWSSLRTMLSEDKHNKACLSVVDQALFVVCLDDTTPENLSDVCNNYLCGTYKLQNGEQIGTCVNRWYDKLQIIVCADGSAGINFEHTGVDGHTVLRFAADIFTEGLMLLARSINPSAPTLFHAPLSPQAKSYKPPRGSTAPPLPKIDTTPKKLEWNLTPAVRTGIRFAERRISDLICQNDCQALEFKGFGKNFITSHGMSPDAFVQMAFQAAWFGLYGRVDCVYEPAMTKAFLHGRTEAIRSVQPESVNFTKTFYSDASPAQKVAALKKACERHGKLTKECSQGLGQDRHLYAMYCLAQRQLRAKAAQETQVPVQAAPASTSIPSPAASPTSSPEPLPSIDASTSTVVVAAVEDKEAPIIKALPSIYTDHGWATLGTSVLSTSNCGNPALRLFGFGPVTAEGYGLGYIIKEDGISVCASSKHLQTRRFLDTLQGYLYDMQKMLVALHKSANERPSPFVDHLGVLRDGRTGRAIHGALSDSSSEDDDDVGMPGYSFFDSGEVARSGRKKRSPFSDIGKVIPMAEY